MKWDEKMNEKKDLTPIQTFGFFALVICILSLGASAGFWIWQLVTGESTQHLAEALGFATASGTIFLIIVGIGTLARYVR